MRNAIVMISVAVLVGCGGSSDTAPVGPNGWLTGDTATKLDTVAGQLRGLDVAMLETGHRYTELYFAGADGNWDYAKYQADKLKTALETALVRRPKRAASAQPYLNEALPAVQSAIATQDSAAFNQAFTQLTTACNTCHQAESVASFTVRPPRARLSPIRN